MKKFLFFLLISALFASGCVFAEGVAVSVSPGSEIVSPAGGWKQILDSVLTSIIVLLGSIIVMALKKIQEKSLEAISAFADKQIAEASNIQVKNVLGKIKNLIIEKGNRIFDALERDVGEEFKDGKIDMAKFVSQIQKDILSIITADEKKLLDELFVDGTKWLKEKVESFFSELWKKNFGRPLVTQPVK